MKHLKARTKLYKGFNRVPIKILDEVAPIIINGRIIAMGYYGILSGRRIKVAIGSDDQVQFYISCQSSKDTIPEYYGAVKDDVYFIYGMNTWNRKSNTARGMLPPNHIRQDNITTSNPCFTGSNRKW